MLMPRMQIQSGQLYHNATASDADSFSTCHDGSSEGKGKATAKAKMPISDINRPLLLDQNRIKGFISEVISGLI
jgi:hypothetical protein